MQNISCVVKILGEKHINSSKRHKHKPYATHCILMQNTYPFAHTSHTYQTHNTTQRICLLRSAHTHKKNRQREDYRKISGNGKVNWEEARARARGTSLHITIIPQKKKQNQVQSAIAKPETAAYSARFEIDFFYLNNYPIKYRSFRGPVQLDSVPYKSLR